MLFYCNTRYKVFQVLKEKSYAAVHLKGYSSYVMLRKPFGVMVSSTDQTPQVPFMFFLIIHYFERPAPSVRLVKSIHLRACCKYWISREHQPNMACHTHVNMTGHLMYKICNYSATVTAVSSSTGSCAA